MSTPRTVSTPRSRSFVVTALPVEALSPKTVRMPVRRAPTQPRPASSRVMKAMMPVIVSVRLAGAVRLMMPSGFSAVFTMPGRACSIESAIVGDHLGPALEDEAEDGEGESERGEDREEREVRHARGQQVAVGVPVALPRRPRARGLQPVKRPPECAHASTPRQLELVDRTPHAIRTELVEMEGERRGRRPSSRPARRRPGRARPRRRCAPR